MAQTQILMLQPDAFCEHTIRTAKCNCVRGSAPYPAGGVYSAPSDLLAVFKGRGGGKGTGNEERGGSRGAGREGRRGKLEQGRRLAKAGLYSYDMLRLKQVFHEVLLLLSDGDLDITHLTSHITSCQL